MQQSFLFFLFCFWTIPVLQAWLMNQLPIHTKSVPKEHVVVLFNEKNDNNDDNNNNINNNNNNETPGLSSSSSTTQGELILLQPYLPAADPMYMHRGPIGQGTFVISRTGGPTIEELSNENMLRIVLSQCTDLEVNTLVWKCLGYRYDEVEQVWNNNTLVFPNWKEKYPTPPDFLGMRRIYEKDIDQPSLRANQALVRSVPVHAKQSLKTALKPEGWKGYQYKELTPNKTRRAQCANWLIFYRNDLFGYTLEELREKRQQQQDNSTSSSWSPPVKEVY